MGSLGGLTERLHNRPSHGLCSWCDAQLLDRAVRATNDNQERLSTAAPLHFASIKCTPAGSGWRAS